jgi:hypothetical protein
MVMMIPPGSFPGMMSFAIAPTISPMMMAQSIRTSESLLEAPPRRRGVARFRRQVQSAGRAGTM